MNKKIVILLCLIFFDVVCMSFFTISYSFNKNKSKEKEYNEIEYDNTEVITSKVKEDKVKIILNAVGDCTIGYDDNFGYTNSFNEYLNKYGYGYFFSNVKEIFEKDDLTIANLETTFTDATIKKPKKFNFKGPKDYVNVLSGNSVEVVNIANNHIYDYNEVGFNDTINTLNEANVNYFGFDDYYIYEKDNIKIGFGGIFCIESIGCTTYIDDAINYFKTNDVDSIILSFHWGIERNYKQSYSQTYLAHYAIDNGVELVLGHHPHVLQGIELYKDKYIVYSLGNFSFGGNKNPTDKDTMIFNIEFVYENDNIVDTVVNVYPASISSVNYTNDYKPTLLTGEDYDRVIGKIQSSSVGINLQ